MWARVVKDAGVILCHSFFNVNIKIGGGCVTLYKDRGCFGTFKKDIGD